VAKIKTRGKNYWSEGKYEEEAWGTYWGKRQNKKQNAGGGCVGKQMTIKRTMGPLMQGVVNRGGRGGEKD